MRIIFSLIISIFIIAACSTNHGNFLLVNEADESISKASILVSGKKFEFENIAPGQTVSGTYDVSTDSHYDINIQFLSGSHLHKEVGYVTHGFDFEHKLVVMKADILLTDSKVEE